MLFKLLRKEIKTIIDNIGERPIFQTNADKEKLKELFLTILNNGEEIFKINKTYTCDECMKFLEKFGPIIWFEDGEFVSIWSKIDINKFDGKFKDVIITIKNYMNKYLEPVDYKFFKSKKIGIEKNVAIKEWDNGKIETITFEHLHGIVNSVNTTKHGGFTKYYRLQEAINLIEKAKELAIEEDIAKELIKEVPQLEMYLNSLDRSKEIAKLNPYETHIKRDIKLSNLLFTCIIKAKEEGLENAIKFAKLQIRADRFMQEKAKTNEEILREYNELQKKGIIFSGLEKVEPTYTFENNKAKNSSTKIINPAKISREDFIRILNNEKIFSLALLIKEEEIEIRKASALKQKIGETEILRQPIITVYKTGYTDVLWETVKKHGGNINARFVFSLIFGQPCYLEPIDGTDIPDLDLHCKTPSGKEIYYRERGKNIDGLTLDVDMKVYKDDIKDPIENIFGNNPDNGKFLIFVEDYTNPFKRGRHLNNFKLIAKLDELEFETEVVDMKQKRVDVCEIEFKNGKVEDIKWFIPVKNNSMSLKDIIKSNFKHIPVKAIIDAKDQLLFDIGIEETFTATGINKEYLKSEYQRFNQVLKIMADEVEMNSMVGFKKNNSFFIEINGKIFIVEG